MRISDWISDVCSSDLSASSSRHDHVGYHEIKVVIRIQQIDGRVAGKGAFTVISKRGPHLPDPRGDLIIVFDEQDPSIPVGGPIPPLPQFGVRSGERRGGKEGVRKCKPWRSTYN